MFKTPRFFFTLLIIFFFVFTASGCLPSTQETDQKNTQVSQDSLNKSGFTTLKGTLTQQGTSFLLQTVSGPIVLQSLELDLSTFTGQSVTVTGKYSGDELFVSEITQ